MPGTVRNWRERKVKVEGKEEGGKQLRKGTKGFSNVSFPVAL